MRTGLRMRCAALVAARLAVPGSAAQAKAPATKKPPSPPKVPALLTDIARLEPLALPGTAADGATVSLDGVGDYRGILELRRTATGVGAVNDVALEDYLKGISEVPSAWPAEALRAQAVASRTYLLWVLGRPPSGDAAALGAQICATDSCQVYSGLAKERAPNGANWVAAVRDTAGQALLAGGSPILAKYSACNGGRSVSGGRPYLKPVDDPDDARCPLSRWGLAVSYADLGRALAVPGTVKTVRAPGGDVEVEWTGADGAPGHTTVARTDFRAKLDAAVPPPDGRTRTVPSIQFTVRFDDAGRVATLDGRGYGHGIGMSQWGAYGKALRGLRAPAILAAYYGGLQPAKVPAAKLPARVRVAISTGQAPAPPPPTKPAGPPGPGQPVASPAPAGSAASTAKTPRPAPGPAPVPGAGAVVSASAPFRILDAGGKVVVPVATGAWRIVPAARGLQLLPPRDQAGAAGLSLAGVEPATPLPGQPLTVRFTSSLPAVVSATAQPPGERAAPALAPQYQFAAGQEHTLTLPPAPRPGPYTVTVTADSGPGRTATLTLTPTVADPAALPSTAAAGPPGVGAVPPPGDPAAHNGLYQALLAGGRSPSGRASRSGPPGPPGSTSPGSLPGASDPYGLGLLLAALTGYAFWRLRACSPSWAPAAAPAPADPPLPDPELPGPAD